jgi:hypothetical protein
VVDFKHQHCENLRFHTRNTKYRTEVLNKSVILRDGKILSESKVLRRLSDTKKGGRNNVVYNVEYLELSNIRAIKWIDLRWPKYVYCMKQTNVYRILVWELEGKTSFVRLV